MRTERYYIISWTRYGVIGYLKHHDFICDTWVNEPEEASVFYYYVLPYILFYYHERGGDLGYKQIHAIHPIQIDYDEDARPKFASFKSEVEPIRIEDIHFGDSFISLDIKL